MKFTADYETKRETFGAGCNDFDQIVIADFWGFIQFVRGVEGVSPVSSKSNFTGGPSDYEGTLTVSCPDVWGASKVMPLRVGDELHLSDCIGSEVIISYVVEDGVFTDAVLINSRSGGIHASA